MREQEAQGVSCGILDMKLRYAVTVRLGCPAAGILRCHIRKRGHTKAVNSTVVIVLRIFLANYFHVRLRKFKGWRTFIEPEFFHRIRQIARLGKSCKSKER